MIEAHSLAEVTPQQIQYLELHGSGTPLGDAIEFAGHQTCVWDASAECDTVASGAVKPNVGHVEMASGITSLIKNGAESY